MRNLLTLALAMGSAFAVGLKAARTCSVRQSETLAGDIDFDGASQLVPLYEQRLPAVEVVGRVHAAGVGALVVTVGNYDDPETPIQARRVPAAGEVTVNGQVFDLACDGGELTAIVPAGVVPCPKDPAGGQDQFCVRVLDAVGAEICFLEMKGAYGL